MKLEDLRKLRDAQTDEKKFVELDALCADLGALFVAYEARDQTQTHYYNAQFACSKLERQAQESLKRYDHTLNIYDFVY